MAIPGFGTQSPGAFQRDTTCLTIRSNLNAGRLRYLEYDRIVARFYSGPGTIYFPESEKFFHFYDRPQVYSDKKSKVMTIEDNHYQEVSADEDFEMTFLGPNQKLKYYTAGNSVSVVAHTEVLIAKEDNRKIVCDGKVYETQDNHGKLGHTRTLYFENEFIAFLRWSEVGLFSKFECVTDIPLDQQVMLAVLSMNFER